MKLMGELDPRSITMSQKIVALQAINLIKENRCGRLKRENMLRWQATKVLHT